MTDHGACYRSKLFTRACKELGIKHIFTKPYTPQTNGIDPGSSEAPDLERLEP